MRVKALQKMYYNRREMLPGDEYDMDDREEQSARLLVTLGKIEMVNAPKSDVGRPVAMTAPKAEEKPLPAPADPMTTEEVPFSTRRYYRRRDMKSEE